MPGQAVEYIGNVLAVEPMPSVHVRRLPREHIDHRQDTELAAKAEPFGREVHRPGLTWRAG